MTNRPSVFTDLLNVTPPQQHSMIPADAKCGPWENYMEFLPGAAKPRRTGSAVYCDESPIAMRCPACDCRQPVVQQTHFRVEGASLGTPCLYCGVRLHIHGSRLVWWR